VSDTDLHARVDAAFAALAADSPWHLGAIARALLDTVARLEVDEGALRLAAAHEAPVALPGPGPADVTVRTTAAAFRRLITGQETLRDQLRAGALDLRGTPAHLLRVEAAWRAWLHGAVRSPRSAALLQGSHLPCDGPLAG
jgi:hypothetical protein